METTQPIQPVIKAEPTPVIVKKTPPVVRKKTTSTVVKKTPPTVTKKKTVTPKMMGEDEVFTIIEKPDPNVDPKMYSNRKRLSLAEKETVKNVYKRVLTTDNEVSAENIIKNLDKRVLQGLRDILVKKIVLIIVIMEL